MIRRRIPTTASALPASPKSDGNGLGAPQPEFGWIQAADGVRLRTAIWPAPTNPVGVVMLLPGRGEFIEKYDETAQEWLRRGYQPIMMDWRGQGLSDRLLPDRMKDHVRDFADYTGDLEKLYTELVRPAHAALSAANGRKLPLVVCAHSMGGHIALRWLAERVLPPAVTATVLVSPMTQIHTGGFLRPLAQVTVRTLIRRGWAERYAPGQEPKPRQFDGNTLTHDKGRYDNASRWLAENPALQVGGGTYGWLDAAFRSIRKLHAPGVLERVGMPVMLASAHQDKVVDHEDHEEVVARLPRGELKTFENAGHELLMETEAVRGPLWAAIDDFLRRNGALPQPKPPVSPEAGGAKPAAPRRGGFSHPRAAGPL